MTPFIAHLLPAVALGLRRYSVRPIGLMCVQRTLPLWPAPMPALASRARSACGLTASPFVETYP